MELIFKGLFMGFVLAIGVGPVNVICIRRALNNGLRSGLISGLGAASGDLIFAAVASLSLGSATELLGAHGAILQLIGALFLVGWGIKLVLTRVRTTRSTERSKALLLGDYVTALLLILVNPFNLLAYGAVSSSLGTAAAGSSPLTLLALLTGVGLGSMGWWLLLCLVATRFRARLVGKAFTAVNRVAGVLVALCGVVLLIR